jgi:hypothetical protein
MDRELVDIIKFGAWLISGSICATGGAIGTAICATQGGSNPFGYIAATFIGAAGFVGIMAAFDKLPRARY